MDGLPLAVAYSVLSQALSSSAPVMPSSSSSSIDGRPYALNNLGDRRVLASLSPEAYMPRMAEINAQNVNAEPKKGLGEEPRRYRWTHADNKRYNCDSCEYAATQKFHLDR